MTKDVKTFYVLSNGQLDLFKENTLTSFSNQLPYDVDIQKDNYDIAIRSFGLDLNIATLLTNSSCLIDVSQFQQERITSESDLSTLPEQNFISVPNNRFHIKSLSKRLREAIKNSSLKGKLGIFYVNRRESQWLQNLSLEDELRVLIHEQLVTLFKLESYFKTLSISSIIFDSNVFFELKLSPRQSISGEKIPSPAFRGLPKVINVQCNLVHPYNNDNATCKIISTNNILDSSFNRYICYTYRNPTFFPLESSETNKISFRITDEKEVPLRLFSGNSSFIHLELRPKSFKMERFINLRVSSKPTVLSADNESAQFTSFLHHPIEVPKKSKICLVSCHLPNTIATVPKHVASKPIKLKITKTWKIISEGEGGIRRKRYMKSYHDHTFNLLHSHLLDNDAFVAMLNKVKGIDDFKFVLEHTKYLRIIFANMADLAQQSPPFASTDEESYQIHDIDYAFSFPIEIARLFGFYALEHKTVNGYISFPPTRKNISFEEAILLQDYYPHFIMVYCSAIVPTFVAGNFRPILSILPLEKQKAEYASYFIENLNFVPLNTTFLDKLQFTLTSHDGNLINFVSPLDVILHLKIDTM